MDAVGATGAEGVALLKGAALADLTELLNILDNEVAGLGELIAKRSIAQIGAGHAVMDPTAGLRSIGRDIGVDVLLHVGKEGDDVVTGDLFDLVDLSLLEVGVIANPLGLVFGDADLTEFCLSLAGQNLDLLPDGVLILQREDMAHLGTGIAVDHCGSFLVIGT